MGEVIFDLPSHALYLLPDGVGQYGLSTRHHALGLLCEERQRRLEAVRQVARA